MKVLFTEEATIVRNGHPKAPIILADADGIAIGWTLAQMLEDRPDLLGKRVRVTVQLVEEKTVETIMADRTITIFTQTGELKGTDRTETVLTTVSRVRDLKDEISRYRVYFNQEKKEQGFPIVGTAYITLAGLLMYEGEGIVFYQWQQGRFRLCARLERRQEADRGK